MGAIENNNLEQKIIETAQQLFIEKGFVETSMSDIAHAVGINRPVLHYYFRTKDKMFQAVFSNIVASIIPTIQDILMRDVPFIERMELILDEYFNRFTENPYVVKFIFGEIQRDVNHLIDTAKELGFDNYLHTLQKYLSNEMQNGTLKPVPMHFVFFTFYGLLTYPFLSKNLVVALFLDREKDFVPMLYEWKQYVISSMKNLLLF